MNPIFNKNYIIRSPRKMNNNSKSNFYISTKSLFNILFSKKIIEYESTEKH